MLSIGIRILGTYTFSVYHLWTDNNSLLNVNERHEEKTNDILNPTIASQCSIILQLLEIDVDKVYYLDTSPINRKET